MQSVRKKGIACLAGLLVVLVACELKTQSVESEVREISLAETTQVESLYEFTMQEAGYEAAAVGEESGNWSLSDDEARTFLPNNFALDLKMEFLDEDQFGLTLQTTSPELTSFSQYIDLYLVADPTRGTEASNLTKVEQDWETRSKQPWKGVLNAKSVYYAFVSVSRYENDSSSPLQSGAYTRASALIRRVRIDLRGHIIP